jgi:transposase
VSISNDERGFATALAWIIDHAPGPRIVVALEGTRSYGVGLARALQAAGLPVVEIERLRRRERRRGKSDPIDARLAALHALGLDADRLPTPRADGDREALRIVLGARRELTSDKTRMVNWLRALLLTGHDADQVVAHGSMNAPTLTTIIRRRGRVDDTREDSVAREARRLALGIREADQALVENRKQLAALVTELAPTLLTKVGIGPVSAARAIVSWSHHGRCRNDAAFAALVGASPIPASSGPTIRHRLNRGGDRQLNRALHDIVLTRWRMCPRTHAYITKRRAQGKTDNEIRRQLKRYIARELYRTLNTPIAA